MSLSKWYSKKRLMTIILGSIIVLYHTPTGRIKAHSIISCKVCGATFWSMRPIPLKHHVMCYKVLCNILPIKQGTPGRTPSINACVTQHTGPTASRPIRRTNIWFGVLLKVTPLDTVKHVWRYSVFVKLCWYKCYTPQHTGPTASRPIRRTNKWLVSCLKKQVLEQ